MSTNENERMTDERLTRDAERLLRQSVEQLDAATLSRLNRARQTALAEFDRRQQRPAWLAGWQPAVGAALVALVAVGLWVGGMPGSSPVTVHAEQATDLELIFADENLDMIEDLDFYDWVEADLGGEEG